MLANGFHIAGVFDALSADGIGATGSFLVVGAANLPAQPGVILAG
jgi:hypothetical protein